MFDSMEIASHPNLEFVELLIITAIKMDLIWFIIIFDAFGSFDAIVLFNSDNIQKSNAVSYFGPLRDHCKTKVSYCEKGR